MYVDVYVKSCLVVFLIYEHGKKVLFETDFVYIKKKNNIEFIFSLTGCAEDRLNATLSPSTSVVICCHLSTDLLADIFLFAHKNA